jgi:hypothetical protein
MQEIDGCNLGRLDRIEIVMKDRRVINNKTLIDIL